MSSTHTFVSVCLFLRSDLSEPEMGIAIGRNENEIWVIVDNRHMALNQPPYRYKCLPGKGAFTTTLKDNV